MRALAAALAAAFLAFAGCVAPPVESATNGTQMDPPAIPAQGSFALASAAFADGESIPREHTCDGAETSPPLVFSGIPANATTVALLMLDNDVPTPLTPLREVVHWLAWNAPVIDGRVEFPADGVPEGTVQGGESQGYNGPCPPLVSPDHRYVFTAHAVAGSLGLPAGASKAELLDALQAKSGATATLTGLYARALPVHG